MEETNQLKSFQKGHSDYINPDAEKEAQEGALGPQAAGQDKYWLSLEQWSQDPEFAKMAEKEFLSSPLKGDSEEGWARREFLKLMGASLAMGTAGCIRRPIEKIVPYNKQPEEVTLGVANQYSSTFFDGVEVSAVTVKTREGRPLKIEGNPLHPLTQGGTSVRTQAHILSLYDPERLKGPYQTLFNKERTNGDFITTPWDKADDAVVASLNEGGAVLLTGAVASPSFRRLIGDFCSTFKAEHVSYEPISYEEIQNGQEASYGTRIVPYYQLDKAEVIVAIDADFLGTLIAPSVFNRQFSKGRKLNKDMSRLVAFESAFSLTGANADIRVRIKPSQQIKVVMGLAHEIVVKNGFGRFAGVAAVKEALAPFASAATELKMEAALFVQIAKDLMEAKGKGLVIAGGLPTQTAESTQLQIAVNFLNSALDNEGSTVLANAAFTGFGASASSIKSLIDKMNAGEVKTLIIHRMNPVYSTPDSWGFKEALKKVKMVVYTGDRRDETGRHAHFIMPDNHQMESWGDIEITKGLVSLQQPTIRPLYDTRSVQLTLMTFAYVADKGPDRLKKLESYYEYLQDYWKTEIKAGVFADAWSQALQEGFVGSVPTSGAARDFKLSALSQVKGASREGYELVLYPTVQLGDGSMANISWLQELPDPITKICWDNYACVSMATAEKLGAKEGHLLKLKVGEQVLELPTHIHPGLHDEVIAVPVGYGRTAAGKVANNVGVNSYQLIQWKDSAVYSGESVTVENTKKKFDLANPQGHHSLGDSKTAGRKIVVEATLAEYLKDQAANNHKHPVWQMWPGHKYSGHKWGMAIDLNTCTGCNACVVACQSENNISVVGKKYVMQGREMHWIRIDRYFVGDPAEAEVVFQPLMCQHCDNAPCETVCPVLATVHSSEGLNDMVYNRCVGTRYCSNNCPYKVRRFNWFNYAKLIEKPLHLALNPEVTVRARGVMEKCTFCTHRIKASKIAVKLEGRAFKDGDVKTACQTACPTDAIVFGDLNDENSKVAKMWKEDPRNYALLEEFHAAPSVRYFTKLRNNHQETRHKDSGHKGGHA